MSGDDLRRTGRATAGKFGERFGNPIPTLTTRNKRMEGDTTITEDPNTSSRSLPAPPQDEIRERYAPSLSRTQQSSRSNSTLKKSEIEEESLKKISQLTKVYRERTRALERMKLDAAQLVKALSENEKQKENPEEGQVREDYEKWGAKKEAELEALRNDIASAEIDLKYEFDELEENKKLIMKSTEVQILRVENEEDDEEVDYFPVDKSVDTMNWAKQTAKHSQTMATKPLWSDEVNDDMNELSGQAQAIVMGSSNIPSTIVGPGTSEIPYPPIVPPQTTFERPTNIFRPASNSVPFPNPITAHIPVNPRTTHIPVNPSLQNPRRPVTSTPLQGAHTFDEFTTALTQAITRAVPQQATSHSTDRFLARQVQGRDLPTFTGRPEEWPAFHTAFQTTTANCGYSDADNLPRLQKCLKGEALRTVQCMLVNPASVPRVMDKLQKRFGRPELIADSLVKRAREAAPVKFDRAETYVEFGILVDDLVSTIMSLGCIEYLANPLLLLDLTKKLPVGNQLDWVKYITTSPKPKNLETFAEWLNATTDAAYTLCPPKSQNDEKKPERRQGRKPEQSYATSEERTSTADKRGGQRKCNHCSKTGHTIRDCRQFTREDIDNRWRIIREKRACFGCLNGGHRFQDCRSKKQCGVDGCQLRHHSLLHNGKNNREREESSTPSAPAEKEVVNSTMEVMTISSPDSDEINFMMCPTFITTKDGPVEGYIVLDSLSSISSITESSATKFGLAGQEVPLTVSGFNSTVTHSRSRSVAVKLSHFYNGTEFELSNVRTVSTMNLKKQSVPKSVLTKWSHLKGLEISQYENKRPTILIGMDHPHLHLQLEVRKIKNPNAPIAIRTPLGWMLMGKMGPHEKQQFSYGIKEEAPEEDLHNLVKSFFTTESFGTKANVTAPRSKEDIRAKTILDSTLRKVSDGWEVGLLWKKDEVSLPESKSMALSRLKQMERKMDRDPNFASQYSARINEYMVKGYARVLSPEEAVKETPKTFYLPHFMAYNPKKPKKLRFVFDAAAKVQGQSLNDHLLQGPDKMVSLPGTLLKFRQRQIAVSADIQDMFHRVHVRPEDAQSQRFLWRGMDRTRSPDVYEMSVLIFGAACSPSCAQEAKDKNAETYRQQYPEAYNAILDKHYVDDYLNCHNTVEEAVILQQQICEVHEKGGFKLCNWLSNSKQVMEAIPKDLRAQSMKNLDMSDTNIERVLGLYWKPEEDTFTFSLNFLKAHESILDGEVIPTKREVLSLVMSIYDPLGFLSLLTVKAKIIIQACWKKDMTWDDEIPEETVKPWMDWLKELKKIPDFRLPRCFSPELRLAEEVQLHIFCDASEEAFGAIAYLRISTPTDHVVSLVMAKSKVAPIKVLSIPRLELQAAVMGARMARFIRDQLEIPIHKCTFWSDSRTVICWIRGGDGRRFQQFVAHRVGELQELTDVGQWRWIPTNLNVSDEMTRLNKRTEFDPKSRWVTGPSFLREEEEAWPIEENIDASQFKPDELEVRKAYCHIAQNVTPIIDVLKFSKWTKLIRTTAYVLKFVKRLKSKTPTMRSLSVEEVNEAERWWCRHTQKISYPEEYESIQNDGEISKASRLYKLSTMIDENGIIRLRGRLEKAAVPVEMKRPIILDKTHPYTRLLVSHYHAVCGHHGHERIANEMRQLYHIPGLRTAVKSAANRCQRCKNIRANPAPPEMGQLPKYRLQANVHPFQHTGLDYFGPVEVIVKRSREKRYVALFTCLSTRAVHLEVAHSLSTDACIMALRRFISRRGCPTSIHSDNGTNFVGAKNELAASLMDLDQDKINNECSSKGIQWTFICPAAPHFGGSWERLVRSVKVALGETIKQKNLHDEVLLTLLAEAEHTVNSHPLTHVPDDPDDCEALTPNHFLMGQSSNLQPTGEFSKDDLLGRKQWRVAQQMSDHFWRRWVREYLPTLLRREKWCEKTRPIQEGDVVVEVNPNLQRNKWPKGRVTKTYPGEDGIIRVVDIKLANNHVYKRPVAKLCILDVMEKEEDSSVKSTADQNY